MSSLESRVLSIVRSETAVFKQQLGRLEQANSRLENAISLLKNDVGGLKTALDSIQGNLNVMFPKFARHKFFKRNSLLSIFV